jgi:hypothetical protein
MIAKIIAKDFIIMRFTNPEQFNKHEYLNRSNGQLVNPIYNAPQKTNISEIRLERS